MVELGHPIMDFHPIESKEWISAINPCGERANAKLSRHSDATAYRVPISMSVWQLPAGKPFLTRSDTYGWKPQLSPTHRTPDRAVGEVDLVRRLEEHQYGAFWVDSFGSAPEIWRRWARRPSQLPRWAGAIDVKVRAHPLMKAIPSGGIPDVLGFLSPTSEYFFVEYKGPSVKDPRRQDEINERQDAWFQAALDLQVITLDSYVVAEWRPSPEAVSLLLAQNLWRPKKSI